MLYKTENMTEMEGSCHKHMIKNGLDSIKATIMYRMESNTMQFSEVKNLLSIMQGPTFQLTDVLGI